MLKVSFELSMTALISFAGNTSDVARMNSKTWQMFRVNRLDFAKTIRPYNNPLINYYHHKYKGSRKEIKQSIPLEEQRQDGSTIGEKNK
jgi:hypothetical protein